MTHGGSSASRLEHSRSSAVTSPSSSLLSFRADRLLSDTPLHLDVLPGRLAGEDLVEAQVELVLLRHLRHPPVRRLVLGEGNEDHLVRLPGPMPEQLHERPRDLGSDVSFPVLHELRELRLLAGLKGGMGNRSKHEDPPCSLTTRRVSTTDAGTIPSIGRCTVRPSEQLSSAGRADRPATPNEASRRR